MYIYLPCRITPCGHHVYIITNDSPWISTAYLTGHPHLRDNIVILSGSMTSFHFGCSITMKINQSKRLKNVFSIRLANAQLNPMYFFPIVVIIYCHGHGDDLIMTIYL